jgi:ABC-type phosphate/phosphonate transport system substrate-binding protein
MRVTSNRMTQAAGRLAGGRRAAAPAALTLAFLLLAWTVVPRAQTRSDDPGVLHFGFTSALLGDVNESEAMAAMTVWVRAVGRAAGAYRDAEAAAFPDVPSLLKAVGRTDLFALSSYEYLSAEQAIAGDPCMAYEASGEVEVEYVLLARAGTPSLASLRGKRLVVQNNTNHRRVADVWLDLLMMEAGVPERDDFWSETKLVVKSTQAILPLYFGRTDAALVTRASLDISRELNPDVGRKLTIVARSPKLLPGLICARRSLGTELRQRYVQSATTLHERPEFKQTFMVLRLNRLVPWDPHLLDSARALVAQYQALRRKLAK